jgi:ribosomal protein S18 acetylase RimI-like enzyme
MAPMSPMSHTTVSPTRRSRREATTTPAAGALGAPLRVQAAGLGDVPQVLQLALEAAQDRSLNPQYLQWPYQVGLAKSLFATVLWHRFRDDVGAWPARLQVVRDGKTVLGFSILRQWPLPARTWPAGSPAPQELYMLCVSAEHRRRGLARLLMSHATQQIAPDQALVITALRNNRPMTGLLKQLGATPLGQPPVQLRTQAPQAAFALGCTANHAMLASLVNGPKPGTSA